MCGPTAKGWDMEVEILSQSEGSAENTTCKFYLEKKKRFCRLDRIKGSDFCVQHGTLSSDASDVETQLQNIRIKCPLDPTHTCSKINLSKHLKKCNVTKMIPKQSWYVPGINSGREEKKWDDSGTIISLKDVSIDELKDLIGKLENIAQDTPKMPKEPFSHQALSPEIKKAEGSSEAMKKVVQNSCLLGLLNKTGLLLSPSCYIEFGAGRGQLTMSIIKAIPDAALMSSGFVLVERGANRRKLDAKYRQTGRATIERIRCDIKDLCLKEIDVLKEADSEKLPLVAVSKHLCGSATDLTLRCVVATAPDSGFDGGVIALCCHHRCNWVEYVGKQYFEKLGLSSRDFSIISSMSSWAVCCFPDKGPTTNKFDFIADDEKEKIGILCKNVIDRGRVDFLSKNNFRSYLIEYTSKSVTLENIALVFVRDRRK